MTGSSPVGTRRTLAEGLGTMAVVFAGAGAVCLDRARGGELGLTGLALANGGVLGAVLFVSARPDPAHVNPGVTLASMLLGRTPARAALHLLVAQLCGAALAGTLLRLLFPEALEGLRLGAPLPAPGTSWVAAAAVEASVAFAWVYTALATSAPEKRSALAPLAVGLVYATGVALFAPFTGGTGNPWRAFGPGFASGSLAGQAPFWLGPLAGGLVATAVHGWLASRAAPTHTELGTDAGGLYREAVSLYRGGQLEEAAQAFASVTTLRPEWPEPYYFIGLVYRDFGDEATANAFFDAAMHLRRNGADSAAAPPPRRS